MKNLNKTKSFSAVKSLNKTNKNTKNINGFDDEDEYISTQGIQGTLGYFTREITNYEITVPLDEEIKSQSYYRQVAQRIQELGQGDTVKFEISTPGGNLNGLLSILSALEKTEATSVAVINGEAYSAGAILALNCDLVLVAEHASLMIHDISLGGASGKMSDIARNIDFIRKQSTKLAASTYEGFLSPEEIEDMHKGVEFYFDADEILVRLEARQRYFEETYGEPEKDEEFDDEEYTEETESLVDAENKESEKVKVEYIDGTTEEYVVPS